MTSKIFWLLLCVACVSPETKTPGWAQSSRQVFLIDSTKSKM